MIRRRIAAALAGAALIVGLAGCAGRVPLDGSAAADMQDSVVAVAQLAADGDPTGANARLDQLQTQLDSAVDGDLVSAARAARIQNAIDVVRADLAALIAAPSEPAPAPAPTTPADNSGSSSGNGDTVGDNGSSNENSGPGNNNGNPDGNNGKGKGSGGKGG